MSSELQEKFFRFIPYEYDINTKSGVKTVNVSKRYSNQAVGADLPCIVLTYISTGIVNFIYLNNVYTKTQKSIDIFTIDEETADYYLRISQPNEILEVSGYTDGYFGVIDDSNYTFVNMNGNSYIHFDTIPDHDTECRVSYSHYKIRAEYGGEFIDRVQVDVITTDYEHEDGTFINGIVLAKEITRQLTMLLNFGFDHDFLVVRRIGEARDLTSIAEHDHNYRYTFDANLAYHDTYTKILDSINQVNYELHTQVIENE